MSYRTFMTIYLAVNNLFWGATAVAVVGFTVDFFKTLRNIRRQA